MVLFSFMVHQIATGSLTLIINVLIFAQLLSQRAYRRAIELQNSTVGPLVSTSSRYGGGSPTSGSTVESRANGSPGGGDSGGSGGSPAGTAGGSSFSLSSPFSVRPVPRIGQLQRIIFLLFLPGGLMLSVLAIDPLTVLGILPPAILHFFIFNVASLIYASFAVIISSTVRVTIALARTAAVDRLQHVFTAALYIVMALLPFLVGNISALMMVLNPSSLPLGILMLSHSLGLILAAICWHLFSTSLRRQLGDLVLPGHASPASPVGTSSPMRSTVGERGAGAIPPAASSGRATFSGQLAKSMQRLIRFQFTFGILALIALCALLYYGISAFMDTTWVPPSPDEWNINTRRTMIFQYIIQAALLCVMWYAWLPLRWRILPDWCCNCLCAWDEPPSRGCTMICCPTGLQREAAARDRDLKSAQHRASANVGHATGVATSSLHHHQYHALHGGPSTGVGGAVTVGDGDRRPEPAYIVTHYHDEPPALDE